MEAIWYFVLLGIIFGGGFWLGSKSEKQPDEHEDPENSEYNPNNPNLKD